MMLTSMTLVAGAEKMCLVVRKQGIEMIRIVDGQPPEVIGIIKDVSLTQAVEEAYKKGWKMA